MVIYELALNDGQGLSSCAGTNTCDTQAFSAPIDILPLELLSEIFEVARQDKISTVTPTAPWPEIVVSQVCRTWHDIALSSPTLWSTFIYDVANKSKEWKRMERYLERSQDRKLSLLFDLRLDMDIPCAGSDLTDSLATMALGAAFKALDRWKEFTLISTTECFFNYNFSQLVRRLDSKTKRAQHLESFTLLSQCALAYRPSFLQSLVPRLFEMGAPKLRVVRINNIACHFLPPLYGVTELFLESNALFPYLGLPRLLELLRLPKLSRLSMRSSVIRIDPTDSLAVDGSIDLPKLEEFCFDGEGHMNFTLSEILPQFRAPLLHTLVLGAADLLWMPDMGSHEPFPNVRTVVIYGASVQVQFYVWIAKITPTCQHLKLIQCDRHLFLHKEDEYGQPPLPSWPAVETISFFSPYPNLPQLEALCRAQPKLRTLRLNGECLTRPDIDVLSKRYNLQTFVRLSDAFPETVIFKLPSPSLHYIDKEEYRAFKGLYI